MKQQALHPRACALPNGPMAIGPFGKTHARVGLDVLFFMLRPGGHQMIAQTYARVVVFLNGFFELAHLLQKITAAAAGAATPYVAAGAPATDATGGAATAAEAAAS